MRTGTRLAISKNWPERADPTQINRDRAEAAKTDRAAREAASIEKKLSYQFPSTKELIANYDVIDVPAGLAIPDGQGAWFGLTAMTPRSAGQELYWTGLHTALWPCDVAGSGRTSPFAAGAGGWLAWGDTVANTNTRNTHAYIVAGVNLNWVEKGRWTPGPRLSGQTDATTGEKSFAPDGLVEWKMVSFPNGSFPTNAATAKQTVIQNTLPLQVLVPQRTTFSIALCIAPRSINGLVSASSIACGIRASAAFGIPFSDKVFTQT